MQHGTRLIGLLSSSTTINSVILSFPGVGIIFPVKVVNAASFQFPCELSPHKDQVHDTVPMSCYRDVKQLKVT